MSLQDPNSMVFTVVSENLLSQLHRSCISRRVTAKQADWLYSERIRKKKNAACGSLAEKTSLEMCAVLLGTIGEKIHCIWSSDSGEQK